MIRIELPELQDHQLSFTPENAVRGPGAPTAPVTFLSGRIRIGGPVAVPITPSYVESDPGLRTFVSQEEGRFAYHLVHLALTCEPEPENQPLERVRVALELSAAGINAPIAWSMTPQRISDSSEVTSSWEFAPQLKLTEVVEVSVGKVGGGRKQANHEVYLDARNELRHDPLWELKRTRTMSLGGAQRLALVVRSPWQARTTVSGKVTGSTLYRSILRRETADLPWPLPFTAEF